MTRRPSKYKAYVTYTVYYSYLSPFTGKWVDGDSISYEQTVDAAMDDVHSRLVVASYSGFHVTKVEQTEWDKPKPR